MKALGEFLYPALAIIFFASLIISTLLLLGLTFKPAIWRNNLRKIKIFASTWFVPYIIFILFFTGPEYLNSYPPAKTSQYKLPWKAGDSRFVAQGNRSFTSHRGYHLYAWDFFMLAGTEVLAAREGKVTQVEDSFDGVGMHANAITIEHADGESSVYAHLKHKGVLVKIGDAVTQGQAIALSGMTGQAPGPHLHFYVINKEKTSSIPISFNDVPGGGIPFAGHFYTSENGK